MAQKQGWHCERCDRRGAVDYEDDEGVWAVVTRIRDDHRAASPECSGGDDDIRAVMD